LPNVVALRQLENLEELQISQPMDSVEFEDETMASFDRNFYRVLPKLKIYNVAPKIGSYIVASDLDSVSPCAQEECTTNFDSEEEM